MIEIVARCLFRCPKRLHKRRSIAVCARRFQIKRTLEKLRCVYFAENARSCARVKSVQIGAIATLLKVVKELGGKFIIDLQLRLKQYLYPLPLRIVL